MDILSVVLIFIFLVSGFVAYFISASVRKKLLSTGSAYTRSVTVITFILSFGVILIGLIFLLLVSIPFHR